MIGIIYAFAYKLRNKNYSGNNPLKRYFIPALSVKIAGAVFIGLIYGFYYNGGDSYYFFNQAQIVNSSFNESAEKWVNLLFHIPAPNDPEYYSYISKMEWYQDPSSYAVISITAFLSVFTLNTYLPTAVLFAFISFSGVWALFRTFASLYPSLIRPIAIAILFIPSVVIWGSGIFKDTLCLFGLGWLTYGTFRILVQKDFRPGNIILTILSFLLIARIKVYILLAFTPALVMWLFFYYTQRIKNSAQKILVKLIILAILVGGFLFTTLQLTSELGSYSLDRVVETVNVTSGWIHYASGDEGSAYSLGEVGHSYGSLLLKFPLAVNVTLFRPYIWESRKVLVLFSALEALLFLFITLKIIFTLGVAKIWRTISKDPTIQFCLIFSIIFAFAVGISSYNFGALSRYKIPCLPFFALALMLIYYKNVPLRKNLIPFIKFN
ncbi:MAG: hypothetical protein JST10_13245 [Bacteroidetes bacterium]|nr:hypothetical protein [Bacteroidota bacterium]MBS1633527.1 hypothetical protein [Bacteroidota bacterium]